MRELFRYNDHGTWQEPELFDALDDDDRIARFRAAWQDAGGDPDHGRSTTAAVSTDSPSTRTPTL